MTVRIGVVTGAASGMGRACGEHLRPHVDQVLAVDREAPRIEGTIGIACDVRDPGAVDDLTRRVRQLGAFRALVHCAGLSPAMADARTIVDVNLLGTVRVLDAFEPLVEPGAVAVPFASGAGYLPIAVLGEDLADLVARTRADDFLDRAGALLPDTGVAYAWSKAGVQREARAAAVRWAPLGGRVVSVSPGSIDTPMGRLELEHQPMMREFLAHHPMQRLGRADEVAAVAAFLASDAASFVSGVDVLVDGGDQALQAASAPHSRLTAE